MNTKNGIKIEYFEEVPSTNDYAKAQREKRENLIVVAKRQTGGRGTKGRSFVSNEGGVYLTKLSFYDSFPAREAFKIMAQAAVAVCVTLEGYGLKPVIKWVNDIYVNDRKICGILIENVFSGDKIVSSVVGIGVNVYNALPDELRDIATTMKKETGETFSVEEVTARLIDELKKPREIEEYIQRVGYLGREATLIFGDERVHGTLLSVDDTGGMWVRIDGQERRLTAAEVSLQI